MKHDPSLTHAALAVAMLVTLSAPIHASEPVAPTGGGGLGQAPGQTADEGVLRPSTRPTFASFGLGPSLGLTACNDNGCSSASNLTQIKLAQEIGYHVSGNGKGFAIGASMEEAFGDNLLRLQPGVKMWWDIQPSQRLAFYIAPSMKLGYAYFNIDAGPFGSSDDHAFNAQVGVEGRLVLGDRGMVFLKPFTLDTFVTDDGVLLNYDIMVGGAVTF